MSETAAPETYTDAELDEFAQHGLSRAAIADSITLPTGHSVKRAPIKDLIALRNHLAASNGARRGMGRTLARFVEPT